MIHFIIECKRIYDRFSRHEMTVYAAQASFFIIISAFPFMMLLLTLVQIVPTVSKSDVLNLMVSVMPNVLSPLVMNVVDDLFTKSPGTVVSITAITALWSASRGMLSMERGLNRVNETKEKRNYIMSRLICSGYTIIFILVCVMSLVLLVFGSSIQNFINRTFPVIAAITDYIISIRTLLALTILILCFMGLYTFVPKEKLIMREQFPGAVFSTICWIGFSYGFSIYFNNFKNFSYMYGSLTAIVLLMLWLYFCICILFLGAEINYYYRKVWMGKHGQA